MRGYMKVVWLAFLIAAAPITDAVEDLGNFDYEDMAVNTGIRRMLLTPAGTHYFWRAFMGSVELGLTPDQNMRALLQWSVYEFCKGFELHSMEVSS